VRERDRKWRQGRVRARDGLRPSVRVWVVAREREMKTKSRSHFCRRPLDCKWCFLRHLATGCTSLHAPLSLFSSLTLSPAPTSLNVTLLIIPRKVHALRFSNSALLDTCPCMRFVRPFPRPSAFDRKAWLKRTFEPMPSARTKSICDWLI
jgi:hypothetical protein